MHCNTPKYTIREVAKKFGLSNATLRMYERAGLIMPFKKNTGHRLYSDEDIARIEFIVKAIREEGLNLEGIRQLLALLPCWELRPCSEENKVHCPAYDNYKNPCWMVPDSLCQSLNRECRLCCVYRQSFETMRRLKGYMSRPSLSDEEVQDEGSTVGKRCTEQ